ncbi:acyl-protein thioesterase 1 [Mytilinidion resinicola]|uniref:Acyl-protein thioesterase 1 n=1 Tax=Mytilinidion resinicola TaxID=574789 RepID=A0A6A6Z1Q6_9PEZI|nr:acyl-protein thioesterase 1 [Mytilinidion resinicola]KAF2814115.1 acyl-protein thioesterase 1 [Mytilinidion resinicola]
MAPPSRPPPITIPAATPPSNPAHSAAFIFLHGLGDEASGLENIPQQFAAAGKLPHLNWLLPSALHNHDLAQAAWFMPTRLSPFPSSRPELDDPEDDEGINSSVAYIVSLIDEFVARGIPANRIIVGGFSQGCAVSMLLGLTSVYSGRLGGVAGLSGYLPLAEKVDEMRKGAGLSEKVQGGMEVFLARGTGDRLVPKRYARMLEETIKEVGIEESKVEVKEYEGMGHVIGGGELRDLCTWLERVLPSIH